MILSLFEILHSHNRLYWFSPQSTVPYNPGEVRVGSDQPCSEHCIVQTPESQIQFGKSVVSLVSLHCTVIRSQSVLNN